MAPFLNLLILFSQRYHCNCRYSLNTYRILCTVLKAYSFFFLTLHLLHNVGSVIIPLRTLFSIEDISTDRLRNKFTHLIGNETQV